MDIPKFINDNGSAILAGAAVVAAFVYAGLTYLLWSDATTSRRTANVELYPAPFDPSARYLLVVAENYGPAPALAFSLTYWLVGGHGEQIAKTRTYQGACLRPGCEAQVHAPG